MRRVYVMALISLLPVLDAHSTVDSVGTRAYKFSVLWPFQLEEQSSLGILGKATYSVPLPGTLGFSPFLGLRTRLGRVSPGRHYREEWMQSAEAILGWRLDWVTMGIDLTAGVGARHTRLTGGKELPATGALFGSPTYDNSPPRSEWKLSESQAIGFWWLPGQSFGLEIEPFYETTGDEGEFGLAVGIFGFL